MSMYSFKATKGSKYEVQIVAAVCGRFALPIEYFTRELILYKKYQLSYSMPRASYRTNLFQPHTTHNF